MKVEKTERGFERIERLAGMADAMPSLDDDSLIREAIPSRTTYTGEQMSEKEKIALVRSIRVLLESVAPLTGVFREPVPFGLGTDGSCWTEKEHRRYLAAVCKDILSKVAQK